MSTLLDIDAIRAEFPILSRQVNGYPLVYLDNAASAQKPDAVIDAVANQSRTAYANVHRGIHTLSNETTEAYEAARETVRSFVNAPAVENIIFTKGSTEGINLVASALAGEIQSGDEIVLSVMEHHSNIILLDLHTVLHTLERHDVQSRHRRRPFRHTRCSRLRLTCHLHQSLVCCRHICHRTTTDGDHLQACVSIRHHNPRVRRTTNLRQCCKTLPADESNVIRMNVDRRTKSLEV